MGLLGRLKLQLRASQFHKRRRLNGNRFAVASAFERLEVRSLLSGTALGGNVFTPVDYADLPSFEVSDTTVIGNQVLVHGTNADGHGEVASLNVTEALFSDPQTLTFLSEWEKTHPGALSSMDVKGAYMGPNGIVFVSESATTVDANPVSTTLDDGNTTTVLEINPGFNTYVGGVADSGDLFLYAGGGFVYTDNQVIAPDNGAGQYASIIYGIAQSGNILGGSKIDVDFNTSVQIWKVSDGSMIDTYVDSSSIHYEGLRKLKQTGSGFTGTSTVLNEDGSYSEVVVSLSPANGGYRINGLSAPYAFDTIKIKGVQEIGSSIYLGVTGDPPVNM